MAGQYYDMDGNAGTHIETATDVSFDVFVGGFAVQARVAAAQWDEATFAAVAKRGGGEFDAWQLSYNKTSLKLGFAWEEDPSGARSHTSTVTSLFWNGEANWLKVTLLFDNGAGQYELKFWTGGTGETPIWVQSGDTITGSTGVSSILANADVVSLGARAIPFGGLEIFHGRYYEASVFDAAVGGTEVFHFDADDFNLGDGDGDIASDVLGVVWELKDGTPSSVIAGVSKTAATVYGNRNLVRLYLRDVSTPQRFTDGEVDQLLATETTVEGATALGWLLTAADANDESVSQSVGNTSESWGQPTETFKISMRMYEFWRQKDQVLNGKDWSTPQFFEAIPDTMDNRAVARTATPLLGYGSITARLVEHQKWLEEIYAH